MLFGALAWLCAAIDQTCPCPTNAYCLSNDMCACEAGYIGDCSTAAIPITTTVTSANLTQGATTLFQINPISLTQFLEFNF